MFIQKKPGIPYIGVLQSYLAEPYEYKSLFFGAGSDPGMPSLNPFSLQEFLLCFYSKKHLFCRKHKHFKRLDINLFNDLENSRPCCQMVAIKDMNKNVSPFFGIISNKGLSSQK